MRVAIFRGDNIGEDAQWSDALPQNMFGVIKPIFGSEGYMSSIPGYTAEAALTDGGTDRGAIYVDRGDEDITGHYRVQGTNLYKIEQGYDENSIPSIPFIDAIGDIGGSNQVSFAYSFNNLAIVSGERLYYYNPTDGLREITGDNVGSPIDITWGDGVFILTDGVQIYHSDPSNEENFLAADVGDADFRPDPSLGVDFNEDSELVVFGSKSLEHFNNTGGDEFLYTRIKQKAQKIGIPGTKCRSSYGNTYYMLGSRDNTQFGAYITESGASKKISSLAIDRILRDYTKTKLSDSLVEIIEIDGTTLCLFHLEDRVLCFNRQMFNSYGPDAAWSTLTSADPSDTQDQNPYDIHNFIHDKSLGRWVGGSKTIINILYRFTMDSGDQATTPQECIIYSPLMPINGAKISSLEMYSISGFGDDLSVSGSSANSVNTTAISMTYDGITYSKEWFREYGKQGRHGVRFIARRLGYVRQFAGFKFRTYTGQRVAFAFLDIQVSK